MAVPQTVDLVAEGDGRLTYFFRDSEEVHGLLQSFLEEAQELEDKVNSLLNFRSLQTAIGDQLDDIGLLVGESRSDRDDDEYRSAIELRISINNSEGTADEMLAILKSVTSATAVTIIEHYDSSSVTFTVTADITDIPVDLKASMDEVACAGVRVEDVLFLPENVFIPSPSITPTPLDRELLAELTSPDPEDLDRGVLSELL